jgi:D-alanyl-D-alanine carboxypeptidase/D-alanyl-D-alanine-endopeptidase (penicillin-binding protein 4)
MLRKTLALAVSALSLVVLAQPVSAAGTCKLTPATQATELGKFYGRVVDLDTGKQLVAIRADEPTPSASVLKILTGVAAIVQLPAKFTVATKVYSVAGEPGTLVLQGAGDPTLSRLMPPSYSTYPKPARLPRLATQALAKLPVGTKITKIIVDDTYFKGVAYNPYWKASDRTNGYISPITALQVDAARLNPDLTDKRYSGVRSSTPTTQAAAIFKRALGSVAQAATIEPLPKKPLVLTELASATSSPVESWVDHGMKFSDNTEVEFIARQVSKWMGLGTNYTSIQPMMKETLSQLGVSSKGLVMKDASGLAQDNRVTARLITDTLLAVDPFSDSIGDFSSYLATSSSAGTLSTRFKGANKLPAGVVKAKTGFIPGLYSLAGYVTAKDGHRLVFAFFARGGGVGGGTRTALDSLVVKSFTCGARLTP